MPGWTKPVYTRLRLGEGGPGYRESAPVVESYVVAEELDAQPMRLLGVDPFAEPPFRSYLGPGDQSQAPAGQFLRDLMVTPNTALMSTAVAERYGLRVGDRLTIRNGTDKQTLTIAGLLQPSDDLSRPGAGWVGYRRHCHRAGGAGDGGQAEPHRPDRPAGTKQARAALAHIRACCPPLRASIRQPRGPAP